MFKIITFNANGIRSAARKGFFAFLREENPDAVCIQETKAQQCQLIDAEFYPLPHCHYASAQKKGYSGTALYLKHPPQRVTTLGWPEIDAEGRYLEAHYSQLSLISLYLHSGTSGAERQQKKEDFMRRFLPYLVEKQRAGRRVIICGDFNIAHQERDLKNWRGNRNHSGFLPQERAWLDALFTQGYADAFRLINAEAGQYTWWSHRGRARENNAGWRIDYQIISDNLRAEVESVRIVKDPMFSDHAPLVVTYHHLEELL